MADFRVQRIVIKGTGEKKLKEPRVDEILKPFPKPYTDHSFRMILVGPSGRGKSTLFTNMLTDPRIYGSDDNKQGVFTYIYIFCPTYDTDASLNVLTTQGSQGGSFLNYNESIITDADEKVIEDKVAAILKMMKAEKESTPPGEIPEKALLVFDDLTNELKDSNVIRNLFTKGRKYEVSVILMTNKYRRYNPEVRNNTSNLVLFAPSTKSELTDSIIDLPYDKKRMESLADQVFKDKRNFIMIDRTKSEDEAFYYSDSNGALHKY